MDWKVIEQALMKTLNSLGHKADTEKKTLGIRPTADCPLQVNSHPSSAALQSALETTLRRIDERKGPNDAKNPKLGTNR